MSRKPLTLDQQVLSEYMSDLSRNYTCAGWITNNEHILWAPVIGDNDENLAFTITNMEAGVLRYMSDYVGGWIIHVTGGPTFINRYDWVRMYDHSKATHPDAF